MTLLVSVLCSLMCTNVIDAATSPQRTHSVAHIAARAYVDCRPGFSLIAAPAKVRRPRSSWPRSAHPATARPPVRPGAKPGRARPRNARQPPRRPASDQSGQKNYPWGIRTARHPTNRAYSLP
jgi:hypothetical protein